MPTEPLSFPGVLPTEQTDVTVRLATTKGDIVIQLLPDQGPKAASNFVSLVSKKFYDGVTFHRVEPAFVIQGGDPEGTGRGGPGYDFEDDAVLPPEKNPQIKPFPANPNFVLYTRGTVAMANRGPNTNGSQFFIMLGDQPLPPAYSVFGRVISGMEAVDAIRVGDKMTTVSVE
ncbi:MAG: peptidyl-prolyl cis-trans isomerase peptidyl-prolyl cis-trans isomerase [Candidatus Parcubacteria bacterium]|jgi:cyclophilin family peptidyl-prolyl cis-trans isomerase